MITISAVSAAIQNCYKFKENSNLYFKTAKLYAKIQNKIECIGNIHPEYRTTEPIIFFKKIQDTFDNISDNRIEVSNCMSKNCYNKNSDSLSYLEDKHVKYKSLNDKDKLNYARVIQDDEEDISDIEDININRLSFP
jgi:hypothetical protein